MEQSDILATTADLASAARQLISPLNSYGAVIAKCDDEAIATLLRARPELARDLQEYRTAFTAVSQVLELVSHDIHRRVVKLAADNA